MPELVGFIGFRSPLWNLVKKTTEGIRKISKAGILYSGLHASSIGHLYCNDPDDYCVQGEIEESIVRIIKERKLYQ